MSKPNRKEQKEQPPMLCAYDKERECTPQCAAFMHKSEMSGGVIYAKIGCKRMGGLD
jgi:hypothetical protein